MSNGENAQVDAKENVSALIISNDGTIKLFTTEKPSIFRRFLEWLA